MDGKLVLANKNKKNQSALEKRSGIISATTEFMNKSLILKAVLESVLIFKGAGASSISLDFWLFVPWSRPGLSSEIVFCQLCQNAEKFVPGKRSAHSLQSSHLIWRSRNGP